jgi:hypothetical protein
MADSFMTQALHPNLFECIKTSNSDRIRLESPTLYFGVGYGVLTIKTFHIRDAFSVTRKGGPLEFVNYKCAEKR